MSLLKTILEANNGAVVKNLASQFGLDNQQIEGALKNLVPALAVGASKKVQNDGGMNAILDLVNSGNFENDLEQTSKLDSSSLTDGGNSILGMLLGSKDVSRNVAGHAAKETGIDSSILKKMLPVVATLAMGSIAKNKSSLNLGDTGSQGQSMLMGFLDADNDGSVVDDLLGMAKKFF